MSMRLLPALSTMFSLFCALVAVHERSLSKELICMLLHLDHLSRTFDHTFFSISVSCCVKKSSFEYYQEPHDFYHAGKNVSLEVTAQCKLIVWKQLKSNLVKHLISPVYE